MAKTKVTAKLVCAFVFAYANCWFSDAAAHLFSEIDHSCMASLLYM